MLTAMTWSIKLLACLVGLAVWSTVGVLIAVAKLVRVVAAFSVKATLQAFKDQDMRPAERSVQTALAFWPDGVRRILKILGNEATFEKEEILPWAKVLPSLTRDIVYMCLLYVPFIAYYLYIAHPERPLSELPAILLKSLEDKVPDAGLFGNKASTSVVANSASGAVSQKAETKNWIQRIGASAQITPGKGIGLLLLGTSEVALESLLGKPARIDSNKGGKGKWLAYADSTSALFVYLSEAGSVEKLQVVDSTFPTPNRLPRINEVSISTATNSIEPNVGKANTKTSFSSNACATGTGDSASTRFMYSGLSVIACLKNERVAVMEVFR